jgi:hypothetical protein
MGRATGEPETRGVVGCTVCSRACPVYCGCSTSFWRFFCKLSFALQLKRGSTTRRCALLSHVLRLGATMSTYLSCGEQLDSSGIHGLACRKSSGRHMHRNAVNDLIKRALKSANIRAILEPHYLSRDDGKRPDGMSAAMS